VIAATADGPDPGLRFEKPRSVVADVGLPLAQKQEFLQRAAEAA